MCGKAIRARKIHAIGGDRREIDPAAEKKRVVHRWPRCQLNIEVLPRVFGPRRERRFVVREDDQAIAIMRDGCENIKRRIAMPLRQQATEVGIPLRCFGQQDRPTISGRQFGTENRSETLLRGLLDKSDRTIQSVGIG